MARWGEGEWQGGEGGGEREWQGIRIGQGGEGRVARRGEGVARDKDRASWGEGEWQGGERGSGKVGRGGVTRWGEGEWQGGEGRVARWGEGVARDKDTSRWGEGEWQGGEREWQGIRIGQGGERVSLSAVRPTTRVAFFVLLFCCASLQGEEGTPGTPGENGTDGIHGRAGFPGTPVRSKLGGIGCVISLKIQHALWIIHSLPHPYSYPVVKYEYTPNFIFS